MINLLIKIFEHGEKSGIVPALLVVGMFGLFILLYIFVLIYKKDRSDLNNMLVSHIKDENNRFDKQDEKLNLIVVDHNKLIEKFSGSINELTDSINNINVALVREHITKATINKTDFELVDMRLNETADITFNGAYEKACANCDGTHCKYYEEFSALIQARRKESWHIWEQSSVSRGLLTIVEQCNDENYPKIITKSIPEIISICTNKETKDLPKDFKLRLIKSKIEAMIEKTKKDWGKYIERRINIE